VGEAIGDIRLDPPRPSRTSKGPGGTSAAFLHPPSQVCPTEGSLELLNLGEQHPLPRDLEETHSLTR
jgi:hypothetical protein